MIKVCVDRYLPTRSLRLKAAEFSLKQNPINVPAGRFIHPLAMALETGKKWANGSTITCYFTEGSRIQKLKVEREAHKWEEFANLKFSFVNDPQADVRIGFRQNEGSWSTIGTDAHYTPKSEITMNYGWLEDDTPDTEYQRVVLHEFGHVLGAVHEHNSPVAQIPWDKPAVYRYYMGPPNNWSKEDVDINLFAKYSGMTTQFSSFDPKSIMLYAIPNELTIGDFSIGWNETLSDVDKQFAAICYPGISKVIVPNPVNPVEIVPGAVPIVGSLEAGQKAKMNMRIGFNKGGMYSLYGYPSNLWISVYNGNNKLATAKGELKVKLGPGHYVVAVSHSKGSGVFNIGSKKI